ncbi:hypothetical protein NDU88_006560 [Pleurodeles waltl]|uniref:Uncharacterized protein n=1 Tax=Pleurodeles waltl TaxID=8319 RepID=A0AAV7UQ25_PLEWA|nr:hypothetical protein NDU88_006560 [Pleurodeles waltl]
MPKTVRTEGLPFTEDLPLPGRMKAEQPSSGLESKESGGARKPPGGLGTCALAPSSTQCLATWLPRERSPSQGLLPQGPVGAPEPEQAGEASPGPVTHRSGPLRARQAGGRELTPQGPMGARVHPGISEHSLLEETSPESVPGVLAHGKQEDEA